MRFVGAHQEGDRPEPSAEQLRAMHRRMGPPDNEVPGAIPFRAVLGRNDELAVALVAAQVFSTGILLKIAIRLRHSDTSPHADLFGHPRRGGGGAPLLLGIAYPDGRTISNVHGPRFADPFSLDNQPSLSQQGGSGGDRTFDTDYWLTPLPTGGDLTVIAAWPSRGITEERVVIPSAAIEQGLAAHIELWPWQGPEEDDEPLPPPQPDLPDGSWFAQHGWDDPPNP